MASGQKLSNRRRRRRRRHLLRMPIDREYVQLPARRRRHLVKRTEDGQRKRPTKERRMMDFPRSSASLLLDGSNNILSVCPSDSVFTSDEIAVVLKRADDATTGNGVLWTIRVACLDDALWRGPSTWDVWYGRRGNLPKAVTDCGEGEDPKMQSFLRTSFKDGA